jgi:epoxyqueuosine reductase
MERGGSWTRREFLRRSARAAALLGLAGRAFPARASGVGPVPGTDGFRWRSVSVRRLPELRDWMDKLDRDGRLSADKTWRGYIGSFQYSPPPAMSAAGSLVVMSVPLGNAVITFRGSGRRQRVWVPSGYAGDGRGLDDFRGMLYAAGIVSADDDLPRARLPLKQLAVRSGLAAYGRNNIAYVDGFGSFHQLVAFYCQRPLEDHWRELRLLPECRGCAVCLRECPTGAIRSQDFVIDPARCLTLYNELPAPMPSWVPATAHNALVGCLKCQLRCPANEDVRTRTVDLGEVPEAETAALLSGRIDAPMALALKKRLARISGGEDLAYIARNLKLVLGASAPEPGTRR